jgi:hypothetical protein
MKLYFQLKCYKFIIFFSFFFVNLNFNKKKVLILANAVTKWNEITKQRTRETKD